VVLTLKEGSWWIDIPVYPSDREVRNTMAPSVPRWLVSVDPMRFVPVKRGECSSAAWVSLEVYIPLADRCSAFCIVLTICVCLLPTKGRRMWMKSTQ
jgi:hypothetical protein